MHTPPTIPDGDDITLIGREAERTRLTAILDRAMASAGSLVLISGPAGIGKTTLLNGAAQDAGERGMLFVTGACYDLTTTPPYGPWIELLRSYPDSGGEIPPLPELLRRREPDVPAASQDQFFRAFAECMHDIAAAVPLVMILEDLHWADAASIELLRYLSRQATRQRVVILASYRDDELAKDHPLYTLLPLLARESRAERIDLQSFDVETVRAYVANQYPLSVADVDRLTGYLHRHSQGNPLFMVELLRALERDQILAAGDGGWRLGNLDERAPPLLIVQMIERQLVLLDDQAREALEIATVLGEDIPLDRWQRLAGLHDAALASVIDQGLAVRALEERGSNRLRFRHALIREVLYHGMTFSQRRLAHQRAAELLLDAGSPDPDAVADHFQRAGDPRAAHWLIQAGERAAQTWAEVTAVERYEAALRLMEHDDATLQERGWLLLVLAMNAREFARERTLAAIKEAQRIANETGDRALSAWTIWVLGQTRFFIGQNGVIEMMEALAAIRALTPVDLESMPQYFRRHDPRPFDSAIALAQSAIGQYRDALAIAEVVLRQEPPDTAALWNERGHAEAARASSLAALGDHKLATEAFRLARDAYRRGHNLWFRAMNATRELQHVMLRYRADERVDRNLIAAETEAAWAQLTDIRPWFPARFGLLPLLVIECNWAEACELAAPFTSRELMPHHFALSALGTIARLQGDLTLAWQQVEIAYPDGPETPLTRPTLLFTLELREMALLAAELALDGGDIDLARRWMRSYEEWLESTGAIPGQADLRLLRARYHRLVGDQQQAFQEAEQALALASKPRQPLVLLAVHRLLGELDLQHDQRDTAQQHLDIALDLAMACAAPLEEALTRLVLAELGSVSGKIDDLYAVAGRTGPGAGRHGRRETLGPPREGPTPGWPDSSRS
jgi:tetratricopeptide (TPR) repeat protein